LARTAALLFVLIMPAPAAMLSTGLLPAALAVGLLATLLAVITALAIAIGRALGLLIPLVLPARVVVFLTARGLVPLVHDP